MRKSESFIYNIHTLVQKMDRLANDVFLKSFKITYSEFLVLITVRDNENITQQRIAELLGVGKSSISQRITNLYSKKYVLRKINSENRKEVKIKLSKSGKAIVEEILKLFEWHFDRAVMKYKENLTQLTKEIKEISNLIGKYEQSIKNKKEV